LRKLNIRVLNDDVKLDYPDMLKLAREEAKNNINKSLELSARKYNLRSRNIELKTGDEVFARNFTQSNAS